MQTVIVRELKNKWKEELKKHGEKIDASGKNAHEHKNEVPYLMGEIQKWRISHEWNWREARMNNKKNDIKIFIWENVVKEVPTTMDQIQFYLDFDALHK